MSFCRQITAAFGDILPRRAAEYEERIQLYGDILAGQPPWGYTKKSGLYGRGERRISRLGCADALCTAYAALLFATQADIYLSDPATQTFVNEVLQKCGFWEAMPSFVARCCAYGTGAVRGYLDRGEVRLDFADAVCFMPVKRRDGMVTEGIFRSGVRIGGRDLVLLERYSFDGTMHIERALLDPVRNRRSPVSSAGLGETTEAQLMYPAFAVYRPCGTQFGDSPFGESLYGGCTDTLKAIDTVFDSFSREFVLGRKRIIVPSSCIRTVVDPDTGKVSRYFDTDDEVYQALKCDEEQDLKITDNTTELRVTEHIDALNSLLDILCFQTGLSSGTISFAGNTGLRTAAEVKSMESRTELTMQQGRALLAELIEGAVKAVMALGAAVGQCSLCDVRISFSDTKTRDRGEVIDENIRLYQAGLISRRQALMAVYDCSPEEAERMERELCEPEP